MITDEIWRDIQGYEKLYKISSIGNIRTHKRIVMSGPKHTSAREYNETDVTIYWTYNGYKRVALSKIGITKSFLLHRLVAIAFISNPEGKGFVNHINGIKADNSVSNLEWCTSSENQQHAFKTGLNKITEKMDRSRRVRCITNDRVYPSLTIAAKELNVSMSCIIGVCQGVKRDAKKLVFKYE